MIRCSTWTESPWRMSEAEKNRISHRGRALEQLESIF
ncbi:MAG: non-canonical purine NTP pyrophosphatase [Ruminococcus sp.]